MKLEDQVVSLVWAKKLKELGVKQESYFFWYGGNVLRENQLTQELRRHEPPVSAFTVAELGEMLPISLRNSAKDCSSEFYRVSPGVWHGITFPKCHFVYTETEANARAKMLIYLIEEKLIAL